VSVYGDMLGFFPELRRAFNTFTMSPKAVAGFENQSATTVIYGVIQNVKSGDLTEEGETLSDTNVPMFWTRGTLEKDAYLRDTTENILYKRTKNNSWKNEGGFTCYVMESVIGVSDTQTPDANATIGSGHYA